MSPKLPAVSGKQVIAALEKDGWYVKRVRGSHHVLRHPDIPDAIPVPVHGNRPIKRGTLSSILRAVGISRDEFAKLLR
ncbi:MAG TPA: type II toxin-antitoxin system HicA family toxin [Solirubrobacterales bacterium]|nr:type II toxin-antitoxin system HicA family toxin [Solirubrobacterales bacterium]